MSGIVYLVGAGPGDPQLITLRGLECLRAADVVLYDYLVNPVMASWSRPGTETICLGRHGRSPLWPQEQIHQTMLDRVREGKRVVRLKGGDPAIFARGAEEAEFLQRHGIRYEVIPGITAALAAGSYAGIPLTHRDCASGVAFITGHEAPQRKVSRLNFTALADFPGTLVVYMGVTTAEQWVSRLIAAGKPGDCPVALIRRCSLPDQQMIRCRLDEVPERLTPYRKFPPPVIAIIGAAVSHALPVSWVAPRSLHGVTVMVTRPRHQAAEVGRDLIRLGATVWYQPAIEVGPPSDWAPVDEMCDRLSQFHWLVFSSVNGVHYFVSRLWELGLDLRQLGNVRLAAIGPSTAASLQRLRLQPDVVPATYRAESLAETLIQEGVTGRVALVRASRGREVLAETLRAAGADVTQVVAYESTDVTAAETEVLEALSTGGIHWTMISSSAIARSLARLFGPHLRQSKLVSISPVTSEVLRTLGYDVAAEAKEYTLTGMIQAMQQAAAPSREGVKP